MRRDATGNAGTVSPYQLFMLALCAWALLLLATSTLVPLDESTLAIVDFADMVVCGFFLADFLWTLYRSPQKGRYLATWGWIDLLSSIPAVNALRLGRAVRVMRILRVLRGIKSARAIAHFLMSRREESAALASLLICLLLVVCASIAALQFEVPAGGNIQTAEDALWWAFSTMTTVGYGDKYPISSEGRFVAVFLMAAGVGLFGTLSGLVASWFLSPAAEEADSELHELRAMLIELRDRLPVREPRR